MPNSRETHEIKLVINGQEIPNSYKDLQKAQRSVKNELKGLEVGTDKYIKKSMQLKQINKQLDTVRKDINKVGSAWKKQQTMWDRAKSTFAGTFAALTVQGAIAKVQQLGSQLITFVKQLTKHRREITRLTDVTGRDLDVVSSKIESIVRTYDQDFREVLVSSNALAKAMGITHTAALQSIQDGFAAGANESGEFLSILKEYPTQFAAAGLSAEESIAIITQQVKDGIYSDKGVDTIKEGTIRLREMTKATREAIDRIGLSSKELEESLRSGTITYFEAIQMVSRKLGDLQEQSPEVGTAIADIFGGPGEDAGLAYIKTLGTVQTELDKTETATSELAKANERLAMAYQDLADDDGLLTKLEIAGKNLAAFTIKYWQFIFTMGGIADKGPGIDPSQVGVAPPPGSPGNLPDATRLKRQHNESRIRQAYDRPLQGPDVDSIAAEIDSVETLLELAPSVHSFWAQMKMDTGEFHEMLEQVNTEMGDEFEEAYKKQIDADREHTFETITNAEKRIQARKEEIDATREGFSLIAANAGTVFGQIARLQEDQTKSGIKSAANLANAQVVASNVAVLANQAASLSTAVKGGSEAAAAFGPLAPVMAPIIILQMMGQILGAFASIKETNSAARDKLSQLESFNTGGFTGYGDKGYGKNKGGYVRGTVEEGEYVLNKDMLRDPYVANVTRYIEDSRKYGSSGGGMQYSGPGSGSGQGGPGPSAEDFKKAAMMMMDAALVIQNAPRKAEFTRKSFRDAAEDFGYKESAKARGDL